MTGLRQRMIDDLHLRNFAEYSIASYGRAVRQYAEVFDRSFSFKPRDDPNTETDNHQGAKTALMPIHPHAMYGNNHNRANHVKRLLSKLRKACIQQTFENRGSSKTWQATFYEQPSDPAGSVRKTVLCRAVQKLYRFTSS